jgi:hypothetical protein
MHALFTPIRLLPLPPRSLRSFGISTFDTTVSVQWHEMDNSKGALRLKSEQKEIRTQQDQVLYGLSEAQHKPAIC